MKYDPKHHHRRSVRLKGYDYTQPGAYFVTMITRHREILFGTIVRDKMELSEIGQIIRAAWLKLPAHFSIRHDEWVIMPNHFHGIIWILDRKATRTGKAFGDINASQSESVPPNASPQPPKGTQPGSLNAILQNFKSITTRKINKICQTSGNKIWQRDYYERIIRDERELNATRQYIQANPLKWEQDREYRSS